MRLNRDRIQSGIEKIQRVTLNPAEQEREVFEKAGLPWPERPGPLAQDLARPEVELEQLRAAGLWENAECPWERGRPRPLLNAECEMRNAEFRIQNSEYRIQENDLETARVEREIMLYFKYEGYIRKQEMQVERMRRLEDKALPEELDYERVYGLRREAREKLIRFRPATVGQAGRIAGINSTDLALVLVYLKSSERGAGAK